MREAGCPDVLKLLVSDLITCYETFKANQPKLHNTLEQPEAQALVSLVKDNYILNKQAYDELEYYKEKQALLGKHPIYKIIKAKDEITAMNGVELSKKIITLEANIRRNTQKGNTDLVFRDNKLLDHAKAVLENK